MEKVPLQRKPESRDLVGRRCSCRFAVDTVANAARWTIVLTWMRVVKCRDQAEAEVMGLSPPLPPTSSVWAGCVQALSRAVGG